MQQEPISFLLRGGLDLVTPPIAVDNGKAIGGVNYEADAEGYTRMGGIERYDGRPRPSDASYWVINFDTGQGAISEGDVVTGVISGATGTAVVDAVVQSGSYGGSDAVGYLVLMDVTGTFTDNENLQVSAVTMVVADGTANERGALTDENDSNWRQAAVAKRRSVINAVPGSGPIRGVWALNQSLYAFRDNAGATAGVMHKATSSGWVEQDLGHYIDYTAGTAAFEEGETVTGGTSGATGTIRRIVISSGTFGGNDAAGLLTLSGITGTFQASETITGGTSSGSATCGGAQTANALPAGGHYDFTNHNFYGAAFAERMYAAQGMGRAFEWDGTYFTEVRTGLSDALDKPTRISNFQNHLVLTFAAGNVEHSEIGEPLQWTTTGGAGSFKFGTPPTGLLEATETALIILGESHIGYLSGTSAADFRLDLISHDSGAVAWTDQLAATPIYMDDGGIRDLATTEQFGNWRVGTITQNIEPLFKVKKKGNILPVASLRVRSRDIYRLFFNDGTGIAIYFGRGAPESMVFSLPITAFCASSGVVDADGTASHFIGEDSDGFVYEMDRGTSFDGAEIEAFIRLAFLNAGYPARNKVWHKATLEGDAPVNTELFLAADFAYGSPDVPAQLEQSFTIAGGGGFWDTAFWNEFYWASQVVGVAEAHIDGFGQNISMVIMSNVTHDEPHTLSAMTVNYSLRGIIK